MFKIISPTRARHLTNIYVNNLISFDSREWRGEIQGGDYYIKVIITNKSFDSFDLSFLDMIIFSVVKIGISEDFYSLSSTVKPILTNNKSRVGILEVAEFFDWIYDPDDILV